jgi:hypothetical protein
MSTVHRRDIEQEYAKARRLVRAAQLHLGEPPDPDLRVEQTEVTRQIIEASGWLRKALSRLIGMPKATSKEQLALLWSVMSKVLYTWIAADNALEAFGLDDVEGPAANG